MILHYILCTVVPGGQEASTIIVAQLRYVNHYSMEVIRSVEAAMQPGPSHLPNTAVLREITCQTVWMLIIMYPDLSKLSHRYFV